MGNFKNFVVGACTGTLALSPLNLFAKKPLEDKLQSPQNSRQFLETSIEHRYDGLKGTYKSDPDPILAAKGHVLFNGYVSSRTEASFSKDNFEFTLSAVGDSSNFKIDTFSLKAKIVLGSENDWLGYNGQQKNTFIAETHEGKIILTSTDRSAIIQKMIFENDSSLKTVDLYGETTEYVGWVCKTLGSGNERELVLTRNFESPHAVRQKTWDGLEQGVPLEIPPFGKLEVFPIGEKAVNFVSIEMYDSYAINYAYERVAGAYYPTGHYDSTDVYNYKNQTFNNVVVTNVQHEIFEPEISHNIYYSYASPPYWSALPSNHFIYETKMIKTNEPAPKDWRSPWRFFEARISNNDSVPAFYAAVYGSLGFDVSVETRCRDPTAKAPPMTVTPIHTEHAYEHLGESNAWFKIGALFDTTNYIVFNVKNDIIVPNIYYANSAPKPPNGGARGPPILTSEPLQTAEYYSNTYAKANPSSPNAYLKFRIRVEGFNPTGSIPNGASGPGKHRIIVEDYHPRHLKFFHGGVIYEYESKTDSLYITSVPKNIIVPKSLIVPNPAKTIITITRDDSEIHASRIKIFDLLGRVVAEAQFGEGSNKAELDISTLPNGTYNAQFYDKHGIGKTNLFIKD